jgi:hypothetical protein
VSLRSPLSKHELRQRAYSEAIAILRRADIVTEDLSLDEDRDVERIVREELPQKLDAVRGNEEDDEARERIARGERP